MPDQLLDNVPPHDAAAERGVIGGILRDPETLATVQQVLRATDFYFDHHQKIFQAIADLDAERQPIDLVLLRDRLAQRKHLADVGGVPYLADLWEAVPTGANVEYHAKLVRDAALVRRLIHFANETLRDAYDRSQSAADLVADAERRVLAIGETATANGDRVRVAAEFLRDGLNRIDDRIAAGATLAGLSCGYPALDEYLGGIRPGELIVIGARPSVGKTALALNLMAKVAVEGSPVFLFSLEQPEADIADRLLAMASGVSMHRFTRSAGLAASDAEALSLAAGQSGLGGCPIYLDDTSDQTAARIASVSRRAIRKHAVKLIVIDYLQLMRPENARDNRNQQVGTLALRVKNLARETGVPIILLSQLNREVEGRGDGEPRLSDLRESGDIEAHADRVLLLHRQPNQPTDQPTTAIDVKFAKQRNGPTGTVTLSYRKAVLRFETI